MHGTFLEIRSLIATEQANTLKMQNTLFEMIKNVQQVAIHEAERSARVLGQMSKKCVGFHERCIPGYSHQSYNMGISAVQHRNQRNDLQRNQNVNRAKAEEMMKKKRLSDLDIWQDFLPQPAPTTSRDCRAVTRKITSQLRTANLENKDTKNPLKKILKLPHKTRDASPEVLPCLTVPTHLTHYCLIYVYPAIGETISS